MGCPWALVCVGVDSGVDIRWGYSKLGHVSVERNPAGIKTISNRLASLLIRVLAEDEIPLRGVRSSIILVLQ